MYTRKNLSLTFVLFPAYGVEILIPRVTNYTYVNCFHVPPYEYVVENVTMTQPWPDSWEGVKGYIKGPKCFRHCQNNQYLYAAIVSNIFYMSYRISGFNYLLFTMITDCVVVTLEWLAKWP